MRYLWFFTKLTIMIVMFAAVEIFFGLEAMACDQMAPMFLSYRTQVPMSHWQSLYIGFVIDLLGLLCVATVLIFPIMWAKKVRMMWRQTHVRLVLPASTLILWL